MDAVLNWLWQGGLVAAGACVMLFALRRAGANVRYALCWVALLLIAALPALPSLASATAATDSLLPPQRDPIVSVPDAWWTSTIVIVAAWMTWTGIQLVRFVSASVVMRRARARSHAFPSHLQAVLPHWRRVRFEGRRATLVLSHSVTRAAVLGWGAPMIAVAPSLVRALDPEDLDRVLIHEWSHIQRRDDIVNIGQILVRLMAGWHPALWWIDRRLHLEREIACDEMTVAITGSPKSYAECLMKLSRLRGAPHPLHAPAVFSASGLRARVASIMSPHPGIPPVWSATLAGLMSVVLCLASIAVAGLTLVSAAVFAEPLVSAGTSAVARRPDRPLPVASTASSSPQTRRLPRRAQGRSPSLQHPTTEDPHGAVQRAVESTAPAGSQQPAIESTAPPASPQLAIVESIHLASADLEPPPTIAPEAAGVPQTPQPPPHVTAESSRSPWDAAAAGGTAVGRKSKDAGVATAGFFTRFARRVAGSF